MRPEPEAPSDRAAAAPSSSGHLPLRGILPTAAAVGSPGGTRSVTWSDAFTALPATLRERIHAEWNVHVLADATAVHPLAVPAFAAIAVRGRAEQVLRALSARTNRVLSGSRTTVVGDGVLAETVAAALVRLGARVTVAASDPASRLAAVLAGRVGIPLKELPAVPADHVIVTGESSSPLPALPRGATAIDASFRGAALPVAAGDASERPHVRAVGDAWIVDAPAVWDLSSPLGIRTLDAFVAVSLLAVIDPLADESELSTRLAEAVLA